MCSNFSHQIFYININYSIKLKASRIAIIDAAKEASDTRNMADIFIDDFIFNWEVELSNIALVILIKPSNVAAEPNNNRAIFSKSARMVTITESVIKYLCREKKNASRIMPIKKLLESRFSFLNFICMYLLSSTAVPKRDTTTDKKNMRFHSISTPKVLL